VSDDTRDPEDRTKGESQGDLHQDRAGDADQQDLRIAGEERVQVPRILPVLPVRDVVIYPGVTVPLAIGRPRSLAALEAAGSSGFLIVATQRDPATEEPGIDDLHPVGCVVRIVRIIDAKRDVSTRSSEVASVRELDAGRVNLLARGPKAHGFAAASTA